jgi:hypothetical protein
MRDLIYLLYIIVWIVLARVVNRAPGWQPRTFQRGDVTYVADQRPMGCMMVLFLAMGGVIGAGLPQILLNLWPDRTSHVYPAPGLDAFGRLAEIVGGVCGAYVGLRGTWLWCVLFLAVMALYVLRAAALYILGGL